MKAKKKRIRTFLMVILMILSNFYGVGKPKVFAAATAKVLAVGETVRFDFGDTSNVASGYIGVDANHPYYTDGYSTLNTDATTGYTYGFLGIGVNGYKASNRTDGYSMSNTMEITLQNGGTSASANSDYVYANQTIYNSSNTKAEAAYNKGDATIPIRFAMNVEKSSYYTVTATLANSSATENAVVSLFSERRHEIATNVTLKPAETKSVTFNAAVMDVYYQKSTPVTTYVDDQLNVAVTGKNAALASVEVTRIAHSPTIFICSDSTGCDQFSYMPYYPLQNYTGVGQGITKYFQNVMVSNQGEGGLATNDVYHFNSAVNQIKAGDYLYVEYGHNESGGASYAANLAKYYAAAHAAGAKLILVGPIDRHQPSQYTADTNTWSSSLSGYSQIAKNYVDCLIYGGADAAKGYATALATSSNSANSYMDTIKAAGITSNGVNDAVFIDLNADWITFLQSVSAGNSTVGTNKASLDNFYYTYNKLGAADLSHINDYGADHAGYIFAEQVKRTYEAGASADTATDAGKAAYIKAQVLKDLYTDYTANRSLVTPDSVSDSTVLAGAAPNSKYPDQFVESIQYNHATAITSVAFDQSKFTTVNVHINTNMNNYGKVALKIYDNNKVLLGTIWTTDWLDNTAMLPGADATLNFASPSFALPSNGSYEALVYAVSSDTHEYDGSSVEISNLYSGTFKKDYLYNWDFNSATGVSTTAGDKDIPVISGNAVYDSTTGSVRMTSTNASGGKVTIDLGTPVQDSNSIVTVTSNIEFGVLSSKYMYYTIYDSAGKKIVDLGVNSYQGNVNFAVGDYSESSTNVKAHGISAASTTTANNGYTTITTTINSSNNSVKLAISSSVGSWSYVGSLPTGGSNDVSKLVFSTNYATSGRSCYVDDVSIQKQEIVPVGGAVTGVTLSKSTLTLSTLGGTGTGLPATLSAFVEPVDATNQNLIWSSSDTNVATVSNGVVTPVGAGSAIITVITVDGGFKATCSVTVTQSVSGLTLTDANIGLSLGGSNGSLAAIVAPANANNKNVTWSSSNDSIATVSSNGIVTPIAVGTATIFAKTADGGFTADCTVTVTENVKVTGITLDKSNITLPAGGVTNNLLPTLTPVGVSNNNINWVSSNPAVAVVSDGVVTSVEPGTAVITATTVEGGFTSTCDVKVVSTNTTITNDTFWKDTEGNPIYSQGGSIFKFGDKYYWYGIRYKEASQYYNAPSAGLKSTSTFDAFTCYSSTDLVNWRNEGDLMTDSTNGMIGTSWVGRMGIVYNQNTKKYVLLSQYQNASGIAFTDASGKLQTPTSDTPLKGIMFATSDSPIGPFVFDHVLTYENMPYFLNNGTGDQTLFQDDDGKAYLICSNRGGRINSYVAPLRESDFLDIDSDRIKIIYSDSKSQYVKEDGTIGTKDKSGIEGNCMFKYNGHYYFTGSDLYGWNSSHTYVLEADNIMGPYEIQHTTQNMNLPYVMQGVSDSYSHNTQAGFYVTVKGSKQDLVLYCGDRWSDFAGNGLGYNQWIPLSFDGNKPIFNDLHQWNLNAEEGTWTVGAGNNYITNPEFDAQRIVVSKPVGWNVSDSVDGAANSSVSGKQYAGNFLWQQKASTYYTATLNQVVKDLPNGSYTLKAWIKSSGGQNVCNLYAKNYGGNEVDFSAKTAIGSWAQVVVSNNIIVTNGQCEIGLYSDSPANNWVQIDNLTLTKNAVPVTGLTLDKSNLEMFYGGLPVKLVTTVTPTDSTIADITWSSADSSIAIVDNGVVTPVGSGNTIITASTVDGSYNATCQVTVNKLTPTVTAWPTLEDIIYGETLEGSTLKGGSASVPGTFKLINPTTKPSIGIRSVDVIFIPEDAANYNSVNGTTSVTVVYAFSGVLDPVGSNGDKLFKAGSTIPVKFNLKDSTGAYVSTASATLSYAKTTDTDIETYVDAVSTSAANTGNAFRYDSITNQYIFNMSTKGLTPGTYQLAIKLNDTKVYTLKIILK